MIPAAYSIAQRPNAQRWAISLADVSLLLACVLYTSGGRDTAKSQPEQMIAELHPEQIFEPGEARLSENGRIAVKQLAHKIPAHTRPVVSVPMIATRGFDGAFVGATRMDDWELAAARTAAIGRAIMVYSRQKPAPILSMPAHLTSRQNGMIHITITRAVPQLAQSLPQSLPQYPQ